MVLLNRAFTLQTDHLVTPKWWLIIQIPDLLIEQAHQGSLPQHVCINMFVACEADDLTMNNFQQRFPFLPRIKPNCKISQ